MLGYAGRPRARAHSAPSGVAGAPKGPIPNTQIRCYLEETTTTNRPRGRPPERSESDRGDTQPCSLASLVWACWAIKWVRVWQWWQTATRACRGLAAIRRVVARPLSAIFRAASTVRWGRRRPCVTSRDEHMIGGVGVALSGATGPEGPRVWRVETREGGHARHAYEKRPSVRRLSRGY